ncbi:peptidase S9 [Nocardioides euryhalodurans]|uniref:Peptidase S9 n=1 Tax=Nocardioides euryhalodurans TaxID=2518370 RepID=A0A4P7GQN6_9ACTN|nr:peptidase S9 [Nocardioides euryhalodurans]
MTRPGRSGPAAALVLVALVLAGCSSEDGAEGGTPAEPSADRPTGTSAPAEPDSSDPAPAQESEDGDTIAPEPVRPISVLGLAEQRHRGDRLRLGAVREQTAAYTSYDITYRSRSSLPGGGEESYTISGVLNVPTGRGPFPAVVLAHGYIDPDVYVRGQGMTRERGYLASRGYVALHVDYRNHAESDDDPDYQRRMRLGYTADVINAVKALRASPDVPVDDDRMAMFGRSMGGGVILKALVVEPGLVQAAAPWASVSSLEADNYRQFIAGDPSDAAMVSHGTPAQNPDFWRDNSSRPAFDRITEPVLMVHGRYDDTCPPPWASATQRALVAAGVDSQLAWYEDGHAFGPAFNAAMDRTIAFFDARLA